MTTLKITPAKLNGSVCVPSSKAWGTGKLSVPDCRREPVLLIISVCLTIWSYSTLSDCIGDRFSKSPSERSGRTALAINGSGNVRVSQSTVDCGESGSTLRFMIPLGGIVR